MDKHLQNLLDILNQNKLIDAERIITNLNTHYKNSEDFLFLFGIYLFKKKDFKKSLEIFYKVKNFNNRHYDALFNIGVCHQILGEFDLAIEHYEKCISIQPLKSDNYYQIAICLSFKKEFEKSNQYLKKSIEIAPSALFYLAYSKNLRELGKFDESIYFVDLALNLNKQFIPAILTKIELNIDLGKYAKATSIINQLLGYNNNNDTIAKAKTALGKIAINQGNYEKAIKINEEIILLSPENFNAKYNLAIAYLFLKNYKLGWKYHETRFNLQRLSLLRQNLKYLIKPRWNNSLPKKNLLIWGEQGIGEQILYSKFIDIIYDEVENLIIAVNKKLVKFFKNIYPNCQVIDYQYLKSFDKYDCHIPMGSLGYHFQDKLIKKILINKKLISTNNLNLPSKKKIRCGISWKSTNSKIGHKKSIQLKDLIKIFSNFDLEFINLQYTFDNDEIFEVEKSLNKKIFLEHSVDCFDDINGLAELIQTCDFVITVSNSNAHVAGKIGVKTFLLLPATDGKLWYWGSKNDSEILWYESITPIRQTVDGNWELVIEKLFSCIEKTCN